MRPPHSGNVIDCPECHAKDKIVAELVNVCQDILDAEREDIRITSPMYDAIEEAITKAGR